MTTTYHRRYTHPFPLDPAWLARWRSEQPKPLKIEQPSIPSCWIIPPSDKE